MSKKWFRSRVLWVNAVAALAFFLQAQFGWAVSPELQGILLTALNAVLRFDTKEEINL